MERERERERDERERDRERERERQREGGGGVVRKETRLRKDMRKNRREAVLSQITSSS